MKRLGLVLLVVAAVVALGLVVRASVAGRPTAQPPSSGAVAIPTTTPTTRQARPLVAARFVPKPQDFTLALQRLSTTCGLVIRPPAELKDQRTIHCKATYRTTARYRGKLLDPRAKYIVFYQLFGDALGGEVNSFTIENGRVPALPVRQALVHADSSLAVVPTDVEFLPAA